MPRVLVTDDEQGAEMIAERKRLGLDRYDEVWGGMYVMPSSPNTDHQQLVDDLGDILTLVVKVPGLGRKFLGMNVSDRKKGWKNNYRIPDIAVFLDTGKAEDCGSFWTGPPDFLVEVESPGDDTEDKVPFYSKVQTRELLVIHRDNRTVRLLRYDGEDLLLVAPVSREGEGKQWLVSEVLSLAFRKVMSKGVARTEVIRTDGTPGRWTV